MPHTEFRQIRLKPAARFPGLPEQLCRVLFGLFLAQVIVVLVATWARPAILSDLWWLEGGLLGLGVASTLLSLTRQLPVQNVVVVASLLTLSLSAVLVLGGSTGIPFGPIHYTGRMGRKLFDVLPWPAPILWMALLLNARGTAQFVLRPWPRTPVHGLWVLGITTVLLVWMAFGLDPLASRVLGYWSWDRTRIPWDWYGTPWANFLGWAITCPVVMTFVTPWLINKKPVEILPRYEPLVTWLLLSGLLVSGAVIHKFWLAAAVQAWQMALVFIFALRARTKDQAR